MRYEPPARPVLFQKIFTLINQDYYTISDRASNITDLFYELLPKTVRYKHSFDDLDLAFLRGLWDEVIRSGKNDVHLSQFQTSYAGRSRITQLRFHGLVAKVLNEKGSHIPGRWLITRKGGRFLRNEIEMQQIVETEENQVKGHSGKMIRVSDFGVLKDFGPHYTWSISENNELTQEKLL